MDANQSHLAIYLLAEEVRFSLGGGRLCRERRFPRGDHEPAFPRRREPTWSEYRLARKEGDGAVEYVIGLWFVFPHHLKERSHTQWKS